MNNETKRVKKKSTALAWISLIILISAAGGLTYLKFFAGLETNTANTTPKETTSPVVLEALTSIADNFNSDSKIEEYKKSNIDVNATVENTNIKITYKDKETKIYEFKLVTPNLVIETTSNDPEFEKIFTIIVHAIQKRLDNKNNIDEYIKKFLEEEEEVEGLSKETIEANKIKYQINVSKKIGVNIITEDKNTVTQENANGETTGTETASAGVTTTPKEGE